MIDPPPPPPAPGRRTATLRRRRHSTQRKIRTEDDPAEILQSTGICPIQNSTLGSDKPRLSHAPSDRLYQERFAHSLCLHAHKHSLIYACAKIEAGDNEDSDDDLEIGGKTQDYKCPISLTLLTDPLTSYVAPPPPPRINDQ